jgi:hypothetical protein
MLPEASASGQLRLYRAKSFPLEWELDRVLLERPLVDASLVEFGGKWWMFASDPSRRGARKNGEAGLCCGAVGCGICSGWLALGDKGCGVAIAAGSGGWLSLTWGPAQGQSGRALAHCHIVRCRWAARLPAIRGTYARRCPRDSLWVLLLGCRRA